MPHKIQHLAIIMDGNRRWAKRKGWPAYRGHQAGVLALEKAVRACGDQGIKYLTVYGFSTENWARSQSEVKHLIGAIEQAIQKYTDLLDQEKWQIQFIGRVKDFPKSTQSLMAKSTQRLHQNQKGVLTVALSYGGRDEILRVAEKIKTHTSKITETEFAEFLDTKGLPDPDMVIRTGGVMRLSNFLPWQSTYSELYFTPTLWPDFDAKALKKALADFTQRQRNFGK